MKKNNLIVWRYCPVCGGELEVPTSLENSRFPGGVRDDKSALESAADLSKMYGKCVKCGRHWYRNAVPTVSAIIYNQEDPWIVLLSKRGIEPRKGRWDVVGGFVDFGELPEEAIVREVKEETGLRLRKFEFLGHFWGDDYVYQGRVRYCVDNCYMVGVSGEVKFEPQDDVASLEWVDLRKGVPKVAFKANRDGLREYVKGLELRSS